MKKHLFLSFLLISLLTLYGCADLSSDDGSGASSSDIKKSKQISIQVSSDQKDIYFQTKPGVSDLPARTILPESAKADELTYYLVYQDKLSTSPVYNYRNRLSFNKISSTTGSFNQTFAASSYTFELYALTAEMEAELRKECSTDESISRSHIRRYASFEAFSSADFRGELDQLYFHLRPNTEKTFKGSYDITINHINSWETPENCQVTVGIYDIDKDTLVSPSLPIPLNIRGAAYSANNFSFKANNEITAGEYNLIVKYIQYNNTSEIVNTFEYSELIIINNNQTSKGTLNVPAFLNKPPEAPSCFIAGYKDSNSENNYYEVQFNWCDNSNTESYFYIELMEIDGSQMILTPASDSEWDILTYYYSTTSAYNHLTAGNSIFTIDGSLNKNSASYTMKLPYGKRYIARIKAKGAYNEDSAWAYLVFPGSRTYVNPLNPLETSSIDAEYAIFDDDVTTINRFKIKYELNGGDFYAIKPDGYAAKSPELVQFCSQHNKDRNTTEASDTKCTILNADGATSISYANITDVKLTVVKNGSPWVYWTKDTHSYKDDGTLPTNVWPFDFSYEVPDQYVRYIPYYSDLLGTYADPQPTPETYGDRTLYVKKIVFTQVYKGYENVTFFAIYKNEIENADDYSSYYLRSKDIGFKFYKDGNFVTETGAPTTESYVYSTQNCDDRLVVSKSKIDRISIYINDNHYTVADPAINYDSVHLTFTSGSGVLKTYINNELWGRTQYNDWNLNTKDYAKGNYSANLTARIASAGSQSLGYYIAIIFDD